MIEGKLRKESIIFLYPNYKTAKRKIGKFESIKKTAREKNVSRKVKERKHINFPPPRMSEQQEGK